MKYRLIMDPVYGEFIMVEKGSLIERIIDSFFLQRLRHIRQLGPCYYIYPTAEHTRFQHSLGTMWLAKKAVELLRLKGIEIGKELELTILISALVHDTGHSPYSHTLEKVIVPYSHEELTLQALTGISAEVGMDRDTEEGVRRLLSKSLEPPFTHQLVSSQLDCDRLDYLKRDAFYTGVSFGLIDVNRILVSITVEGGQLLWNYRGFSALESYVMSRYQMYWAVYFHRTNLSVQVLLKKAVERMKELLLDGKSLEIDPTLAQTLKTGNIELFFRLTDGNILSSVYSLSYSKDRVLSDLCRRLVKRRLFKTIEVKPSDVITYKDRVERAGYHPEYYFEVVEPAKVAYSYYSPSGEDIIKVKLEDRVEELSNIAPTDAIKALSRRVSKVYVTVPEDVL